MQGKVVTHFLIGLTVFVSSLGFIGDLSAFEVSPMRHSVYPSTGKNTSLFTVKNTRGDALPLELIVQRRVYAENGDETLIDADQDFIVFPFQALIEPGATQAFRFQYVGDQNLAEEKAYTINVREVPVDLETGFNGIQYVYSFGVVVYVEKPQAKSKLSVETVVRDADILTVTLSNSSTSFARLTNDKLTLSQGNKRIQLQGEGLTSVINKVVVPPGSKLPLTLNLKDMDIAAGEVNVSIREIPE